MQQIQGLFLQSKLLSSSKLTVLLNRIEEAGFIGQSSDRSQVISLGEQAKKESLTNYFFGLFNSTHFTINIHIPLQMIILVTPDHFANANKNQEVVTNTIALCDHFIKIFEPLFGLVDQQGDLPKGFSQALEKEIVKCLFYGNYFSPCLVERYDVDLLIEAPGKVIYKDDYLYYQTRDSLFDQLTHQQEQKILNYFDKTSITKVYHAYRYGFK